MYAFFKSKKFIAVLLTTLVILPLTFFYTNLAVVDPEIQAQVQRIQAIDTELAKTNLSQSARRMYNRLKLVKINVLALKVHAGNCRALKFYYPALSSGTYVLYANGDTTHPQLWTCVREPDGGIHYSKIEELRRPVASSNSISMFKRFELRNTTTGGTDRVDVAGLAGFPNIVNRISSVPCRPNVDFGVDDTGVWVKNGCSARFKVSTIMPLADRSIASTTPNPNPIIGVMAKPQLDDGNVIVTGWACQKGLDEPMQIQLYMGGPAGVGKLVTTTQVELRSGPVINSLCNPNHIQMSNAHAYRISVPASRVLNRNLYAHAVASGPNGTSNRDLPRADSSESEKKSFPGANHCGTVSCSFEDPRNSSGGVRFMVNADAASVKQRCKELGYDWGEVTSTYTRAEWCAYGNARTKYWNGSAWVLTSCRDTSVKRGICYPGRNALDFESINRRIEPSTSRTYSGTAFENRADITSGIRYMVNNDQASVSKRCVELGYAWGEATSVYPHSEWCIYSNARTKYWNGSAWVFGSCSNNSVKTAVCY